MHFFLSGIRFLGSDEVVIVSFQGYSGIRRRVTFYHSSRVSVPQEIHVTKSNLYKKANFVYFQIYTHADCIFIILYPLYKVVYISFLRHSNIHLFYILINIDQSKTFRAARSVV